MNTSQAQTVKILSKKYSPPYAQKCDEVYEIESIIGEGNWSDVVSATHTVSKNKVAIKIIDKKKIDTDKKRNRLQTEVRLHKKASGHPNIVRFIEPYESDIDICLVLELCEGGDLFNRIEQRGCFQEKEACGIIKQVISAVQYLHSIGIVHRDIKPENIVYKTNQPNSEIKLADFGLSKQVEDSGRSLLKASFSGTTAYCAPERLSQDDESKAVDLWSIGCIMYFLLFGEPPFYSNKEDEEEYDDEIVERVLEHDVRFPAGKNVSDLAKELISRLLEKDPTKRITADQVLYHSWIKMYSDESDDYCDDDAYLFGTNHYDKSIQAMDSGYVAETPNVPTIEMADYHWSSSGTQ